MTGNVVVVDTNVFVTARNPREKGYAECRTFLDRVDRGDFTAVVSAITLAELRAGFDPAETIIAWRSMFAHFSSSKNYRIEPVDSSIAEIAGMLRASQRLSLPDAIIAATGVSVGAGAVVTRDEELLSARLPIRVRPPGRAP